MDLDVILEASRAGGAVLAWSSATDVGKVRRVNEDAVLADSPVFVVADGMGGHQAGDIASGLTVSRFRGLAGTDVADVDAVSAELQNINELLREAGAASPMGTTAVGMVLVEHRGVPAWLVFNVGDSRAYCLAQGALVQITRDHSHVQELIDAGQLEPAAARTHPHRNVVTRALGAADRVEPDFWVRPVRPGERYLLCSDGLSGEVTDAVIEEVLGIGLTPDETVDALMHHALVAGGRDNVTALVIDVVRAPTWDEPTTRPRRDRSGADHDAPRAGGQGGRS